eukprot:scaffold6135_cov135-Isochrysis_galbana.AAC.1
MTSFPAARSASTSKAEAAEGAGAGPWVQGKASCSERNAHARLAYAVASAVFSISILYLGAAKNRPITVTDVQSDGRPLAVPRDTRGALLLVCDAVAAVGPLC